MDYREQYDSMSLGLAKQLISALDGAVRNGQDPDESKQLRVQLSRWLKKKRVQCKSVPGVV